MNTELFLFKKELNVQECNTENFFAESSSTDKVIATQREMPQRTKAGIKKNFGTRSIEASFLYINWTPYIFLCFYPFPQQHNPKHNSARNDDNAKANAATMCAFVNYINTFDDEWYHEDETAC